MSELTTCNFCNLRWFQSRAKSQGKEITLLRESGGNAVYMHPKDVDVRTLEGGKDGERARYWKAWLMEITDHCVC